MYGKIASEKKMLARPLAAEHDAAIFCEDEWLTLLGASIDTLARGRNCCKVAALMENAMADLARIVLDTAVLAGKPVIRGTRLSVDFVIGLMADGWSEAIFCAIILGYPARTSRLALLTLVTR